MTLLEAVKYLRESILYDTGGVGVDWTAYDEDAFGSVQLRWTNEELTSFIQSSIDAAYRSISPIKDIYSFVIKSNNNTTTLPFYIKKVLKVKRSDGVELQEISVNDLWELEDFDTKTGEPSHYIPDYKTGTIRTYPIDSTNNQTIQMLIYRLPKTRLSWETDQDTSIEINEDYQVPMLNYAAYLAYTKDEANTYDPNRATAALAAFNRDFPLTSVYSTARKERTTNRSVRYGGY